MAVGSDTITRRAQIVDAAEGYFRALAARDVSTVRWHPDVVFRGPLTPDTPQPIRGQAAVRRWFEGLYPALGHVEVIEHYIDAAERAVATRADVHLTHPPSVLRVIDRFVVDEAGLIVEQENHFDPRPALLPLPGVMTPQERDLLLDLLVSSQQQVVSMIVGLSADQWQMEPASGGWSIAQCAEHLALSEEVLLGMVRGQILATPAIPEGAEARGRDGTVVAAMRDRSERRKTFDFLEPQTVAAMPASFIDRFLAARGATIQYVRETSDRLHHHAAPLPGLGDLDGYQWLLLLASHTERHVAQMADVKALS